MKHRRAIFFSSDRIAARTLRSIANLFFVNITTTIILFIVNLALARMLGDSHFGVYAYACSWLAIAVTIGTFGFETSSIRFVANYNIEQNSDKLQKFYSYSIFTVIFTSVLSGSAIVILDALVNNSKKVEIHNTLIIASLLVPIVSLLTLTTAMLIGFKKNTYANFFLKQLTSLFFLFGLLLLYSKSLLADATIAMQVYGVSVAFSLVVSSCYTQRFIPDKISIKWSKTDRNLWLKTSSQLMLVTIFSIVIYQVDTIMIGAMINTTQAGYYSVASRLARLMVFVLSTVNSILSPLISEQFSSGNKERLQELYIIGARTSILSSLLVGCMLTVFGKPILSLFGDGFSESYAIMLILILGQLGNSLFGSVGVLINMTGHQSDAVEVLAISAIINIALNWILIINFGAIGAAAATAIMNFSTNAYFSLLVYRKLNIIALPFRIRRRIS